MSYDEKRFASAIDEILRSSDLNTISAKRIRKALSVQLGYDVSEHKEAVNKLIEQRFDKIHDEASAPTKKDQNGHATNGTSDADHSPVTSVASSPARQGAKRAAEDDDLSDVAVAPKPRKQKVRVAAEEDDAAYAARLQAEENSRARPTRGGATKKKAPVKKQKKVKSAKKIKENGDAESGTDAEPQRKGGFHKPMALSEPLAELLGETQLSRPQTVKKIWEYVKARDLQDPSDKRQIRCDDAMRAVFKTDRVHMFTMNKILNQNLYAVEDITAAVVEEI